MAFLRRWLLMGLTLVVLAIAVGGCHAHPLKTSAVQLPTLVLSSLSDPKTFNTVVSQEANPVFGLIEEGLITQNGITGELEPALAQSWEVSADQKRIVYQLRPGLKWSDGHPLTAEDVVFTYNEIYLNPNIPADARDLMRIGEAGALPQVRALDRQRVEFLIPEPFAPFLRITGIGILPAHVLRPSVQRLDSQGRPEFLSRWGVDTPPSEIVVPGPYQIERYNTTERVILRRNPYYWRRDQRGTPQPYIERIVLQIVENTDTNLIQFRSGGLDSASVTPDYFALLKREEKRGDFSIYNGGPTLSQSFISFNLNQGRRQNGQPLVDPVKSRWFNNVNFRRAIAHGIDRQRMLNNIFQGLGEPQNSPIPLQSPYYLSPQAGLKVYDHDLARARELLRQAGFEFNAAGQLLDPEGNRVRFNLITNAGNKIREAMGAQIKQDLSQLGIQVDFAPIAFNTLVEKLTTSLDWDCYLLGFTGGGIEPNSGANVWLPEGGLHTFNQNPRPGQPPIEGRQVSDWEQRIGELYIRGAQELEESKRQAIYAEAQQIIQENLPFIYLINPLSFEAVRDRVQGVQFSALGGALWNVYELKLTEQ